MPTTCGTITPICGSAFPTPTGFRTNWCAPTSRGRISSPPGSGVGSGQSSTCAGGSTQASTKYGRGSCRESVGQYVLILVVALYVKNKRLYQNFYIRLSTVYTH